MYVCMRLLTYLLGGAVCASTNCPTQACFSWQTNAKSVSPGTVVAGGACVAPVRTVLGLVGVVRNNFWGVEQEEKKTSDTLDEILKKDVDSEGVMNNILGGLALCYNALANILLYPIFSFLLVVLSVGALILLAFWIQKFKNEQSIPAGWMIFSGLYVLFYIDLFLVLFQKSGVLFLALELERDLVLMIASVGLGYVVGKYFSSQKFEEQELP